MKTPAQLLEHFNTTYFSLHKTYERLFWEVYMGDYSKNDLKDAALAARDAFLADPASLEAIRTHMPKATAQEKKRLVQWQRTFSFHQTPPEAIELKTRIDALESRLTKERSERVEGYIDQTTGAFVEASSLRMNTLIATHPDERVRKACFEAVDSLATLHAEEYVELVELRNRYAKLLGFDNFYAMKVEREDGMTVHELFKIFDTIYDKTKYVHADIRALEKKSMKGLRKPWNFAYMLAGDFTKEEDAYFQFDEAVERWGRSFQNLGITFSGSTLTLDLLDRKGKWNNGFCHWPEPVRMRNGKKVPGASNFTCNVVAGQVGSGHQGYVTLFHEGGHAAHFLNSEQPDVCNNTEYTPMSASFAETHSMFLDDMLDSIEWKTRYARSADGTTYPLDLFERKLKKLHVLRPTDLHGIMYVAYFERAMYEARNLTREKVLSVAKSVYKTFFDRSVDSCRVLNVPHIYGWESAAAYHGYGLATLAVEQWRAHFLKKYGAIVDNPKVGADMKKIWKLGSSVTFAEFVKLATGAPLSAKAYLAERTQSVAKVLAGAKARIAALSKERAATPIDLDARIRLVHGTQTIATNAKSFEAMAATYKRWLNEQSDASPTQ